MSVKRQIICIHGGDAYDTYDDFLAQLRSWTVDPFDSKKKWRLTLGTDLGEKYEVLLPEMPNKLNAKYAEWKIWMDKYAPFLSDGAVCIGHSLGGVFLVRYLSEERIPFSIRALYLIAAPFFTHDSTEGGDFRIDIEKLGAVCQKTKEIVLFHAKDDPVVPFSHAEAYAQAFPNGRVRAFETGGHFIGPEFPELIEDIEGLY